METKLDKQTYSLARSFSIAALFPIYNQKGFQHPKQVKLMNLILVNE